MKRFKKEIEIRKTSSRPFILINRSNKNYRLSIFEVKENKLICSGMATTYFSKKPLAQRKEELITVFYERYKEKLLNFQWVVRVKNHLVRKETFYGISILKGLKAKGVKILENFNSND